MTETSVRPGPAAATVASLPREEVPVFLRRSIGDRHLSALVRELNRDVLSGEPERRAAAERALRHLGFL